MPVNRPLFPSTSAGRATLNILKQAKVFRDSGNSAQVSNLAQTQKATPVIIYPAECVERVTNATSQLSFLGRRG
jgi:DTW domain-containing protein YfiP